MRYFQFVVAVGTLCDLQSLLTSRNVTRINIGILLCIEAGCYSAAWCLFLHRYTMLRVDTSNASHFPLVSGLRSDNRHHEYKRSPQLSVRTEFQVLLLTVVFAVCAFICLKWAAVTPVLRNITGSLMVETYKTAKKCIRVICQLHQV